MIKNYRRDIDTLRAISVLFVIFFHLKIPFFEGGFLGVDIFFVISGFLITKIILNDLSEKKFTIKNFYLRRVRRIIPLVLFVTLVSSLLAYLIFFPEEFKEYYKNLLSVNFFVSNFWYSTKGGYFGPELEVDPLIHFWSLSVEEQFYLFYPILLIFFFKKNIFKFFFPFLVLIIIFSFSVSQFGGNLKFNYPYIEKELDFFSIPQFAFYSTITRGWEILIGCIAALYSNQNNKKIINQNHIVNTSFILLIISLLLFNEEIPHPSLVTFFPIFFTILILIYNENNISNNKILNSKILSSIGLISFSLYLWHQPIFSYSKFYNILEPNFYYKFFLFISIFPISYLSWRFLEKPFRNRSLINDKVLFQSIFLTLLIIGVSVYYFNYKNKDFDPMLLKIINEKDNYEKKYFDNCTTIPKKYIKPSKACIIGNKNNENIEFAIIGDSHAAALAGAFNNYFLKQNVSSYLFTINGCPLSFNLYNYHEKRFACKKYYNELREFIDQDKNIKNIILHSRWGFYVSGERFNNLEGGKEIGKNSLFVRSEKDILVDKSKREQIVNDEIEYFIKYLSKERRLYLISSIPEVGFEVPATLARSIKFNKSKKLKDFTTSYDVYVDRQKSSNKTFKLLEKDDKIEFFDSSKVFCNTISRRCNYTYKGKPLYFDDDHLNRLGTKILIKKFLEDINYFEK